MTFEELEGKYYELRGLHAQGLLDDQAFQAAVEALTLEDRRGRRWTIGAESGSWYVSEGEEWVKAEPPRGASDGDVCPRCGAPIVEGNAFCGNCGYDLSSSPPAVPPPAVPPPPPSPPLGMASAATPLYSDAKRPSRPFLKIGLAVLLLLGFGSLAAGAYLMLSGSGGAVQLPSFLREPTSTPTPMPVSPTPPLLLPTTPAPSPPTDTPSVPLTETPPPTDTPTATVTAAAKAESFIAQGDELVLESEFEAAAAAYQSAVEIDPTNALAYARWARALSFQGRLQERIDIVEDALAKATTATQLDPDNAEGFAQLSRAYDWSGQFDKAVTAGERAVELDPDSAEAHALLAEAYLDNDDVEQGTAHAQRALEIDPDHAEAHRAMAWIHWLEGDLEAVRSELELAVLAEPGLALRHSDVAAAHLELGSEVQALEAFEKAIELYPQSAGAHWGLGALRYNQEQYADAIPYFEDAIAVNATFVDAYRGLGQCHMSLEAYEDAIEAYQRVVELESDDDEAYAEMAWAYHYVGEDDAARAAAQAALDIAPDQQRAQELMAELTAPPTTAAPTGQLVVDIQAIQDVYSSGEDALVAGWVKIGDEPAHGAEVCLALIDKNGTELVRRCDVELGEFANIPTYVFSYGGDIPSGYTGDLTVEATASYEGAVAEDSYTFTYQQASAGTLSFEYPTSADAVEPVEGGYKVTIVIHIEGGAPPFTIRHDVETFQTSERDYPLVFVVREFPIVKSITIRSADGQEVSHDYYIANP